MRVYRFTTGNRIRDGRAGHRSIDRSIDRISVRELEIFRCRVAFRKISIELGVGVGGKKEKKEKQKRVALVANDSIIGGSRLTLSKLEIHR